VPWKRAAASSARISPWREDDRDAVRRFARREPNAHSGIETADRDGREECSFDQSAAPDYVSRVNAAGALFVVDPEAA
jgi:hypothetical protein